VRLLALTSFERTFEPSLPVERDFEPSLPFERAFEPSTILLSASSSPHFPFSFYLGRSPIIMRPFLSFFYFGRSPITIRPFSLYLSKKKQFHRLILHRVGRLEQLDHSRNSFRVLLFLSSRSPGTIRPLAKLFSRFTLPIGQVAWNN